LFLKETFIINSDNDKDLPIIGDLTYTIDSKNLVVFCHGFKGFKDWGCWNLVANLFVENGFKFLKFNFSHNGGTLNNPLNFPDLQSFSLNNYSIELNDLQRVIDFIVLNNYNNKYEQIYIVGHSRGGAIACLSTANNPLINKLVSWAGVADFKERFPKNEELEQWKKNGIRYISNSRTNQEMPISIQFYNDFIENESKLSIKNALLNYSGKFLACYGSLDQVVPNQYALDMAKWAANSSIFKIRTNHTFGSKHPWNKKHLPDSMKELSLKTIDFLKSD
jgi:pimeloyl-ACP methyl ester carboxylesterase